LKKIVHQNYLWSFEQQSFIFSAQKQSRRISTQHLQVTFEARLDKAQNDSFVHSIGHLKNIELNKATQKTNRKLPKVHIQRIVAAEMHIVQVAEHPFLCNQKSNIVAEGRRLDWTHLFSIGKNSDLRTERQKLKR